MSDVVDRTGLLPCSGCQRHVKAAAVARMEACPFCGAVPAADEAASASTGARNASVARDRSVLLFGAAAVATALTASACGRESNDHGGGVVMPYGAPIPQTPDASMVQAPPQVDAGTPEPAKAKDAGTVSTMPMAPAYGAPPVMKKQ